MNPAGSASWATLETFRPMTQNDVGALVSGYRLEKLLSCGGVGSVYLGTHQLLGRKAAIKILADHLAGDSSFVARFFHEARVVNDAKHPNIVDIIDFVHTDEPPRAACIMEHVDGPALSEVISAHRLTAIQALNIARHIGRALLAVHALRVVHRDLKPANVLLAESLDSSFEAERSTKILDFGVAKAPGSKRVTATGTALGTLAYKAPEQIAGLPVGPATDVYALAEVLYEMLAGRPAFDGNSAGVLKTKVADGPGSLTLPADVPFASELLELTRACLSSEPSDRPGLRSVLDTLDTIAPRVQARRDPRRSPRSRNRSRFSSSEKGRLGPDRFVSKTRNGRSARLRRAPERHWAAAAGILLLAAISSAAILTRGTNPVDSFARPRTAAIPEVTAPSPSPARKSVPTLPARVRLESQPSGAAVLAPDGQRLGQTPLALDVSEAGRSVSLVLEGFEDRQLALSETPAVRRVELTPVPPPATLELPPETSPPETSPRANDRSPPPKRTVQRAGTARKRGATRTEAPRPSRKKTNRKKEPVPVAPIGQREVPRW